MILVVPIENEVRSRFSTEKIGFGEKIKKSEKISEKSDFFWKNFWTSNWDWVRSTHHKIILRIVLEGSQPIFFDTTIR